MTAYETVFILKSSFSTEEEVAAIEKVRGVIERGGGVVSTLDRWDRKKLAYPIKKEKRGVYVIAHYEGGGAVISQIERHCKLEESVIKSMTTRLDPGALGKAIPNPDEKPIFFQEKFKGLRR